MSLKQGFPVLVKKYVRLCVSTSNLSSTNFPLISRILSEEVQRHFPYLNPCLKFPFSRLRAKVMVLNPLKTRPALDPFAFESV